MQSDIYYYGFKITECFLEHIDKHHYITYYVTHLFPEKVLHMP